MVLVTHTVASMTAALSHVRACTKNNAVHPAIANGVRHSTTNKAMSPASTTVSAGCHCNNSVSDSDKEMTVVNTGSIHSKCADTCQDDSDIGCWWSGTRHCR